MKDDDFTVHEGSENPDDDGLNDHDEDDYDIVVNKDDEIMIIMYQRQGAPSSPQAFRTEEKGIVLKRSANDLVMFDSLSDETFEYFTKVNTIFVNEIDNEGNTIHGYDAPLSDL